MDNLPYVLPENGKLFYLLTNQEVESFNYYKANGHNHGLDVSLKMAFTEFGRVLVIQVKKLSTLINKAKIAIKQFTTSPRHQKRSIQSQTSSSVENVPLLSDIELARKQGIPESLINDYLKRNKIKATPKVSIGMYRDLSHTYQNSDSFNEKPSSTPSEKGFIAKVKEFLSF